MDVYEEIVRLRHEGRRGALATTIAARGSTPSFAAAKMLVRDDGSIVGTIGGGVVEAQVLKAALQVMEQEVPQPLQFRLHGDPASGEAPVCGGEMEVFVEPILPPPLLYIFGAGHVGLATYRLARLLNFATVIVDDRPEFASPDQYPDAHDVVALDWGAAFERLKPGASAYLLIMTKGHRDDMQVLRHALETPARYIGMIGSKRKIVTIYNELRKLGVPDGSFDRVHAPVGLAIGAVTPEEIAVAIFAEIIAVRRQATAALPHMCPAGGSATREAAAQAVG
jgi:xanthine dehydrogenase accessory factor